MELIPLVLLMLIQVHLCLWKAIKLQELQGISHQQLTPQVHSQCNKELPPVQIISKLWVQHYPIDLIQDQEWLPHHHLQLLPLNFPLPNWNNDLVKP